MEEVYKEIKIECLSHRNNEGVKAEYILTIPSSINIKMSYKCNTIFKNEEEALSYGLGQAKKRIDYMDFQSEESEITKLN